MPVNDRWNRLIYAAWAPVYDWLAESSVVARPRARAWELLALQPDERVLLVGVGTGCDLPYLPPGVSAVAVDLSPAMLARARRRLPLPDVEVTLQQANAAALPFADASFDAVALILILSVVPDGGHCLREAARVLRPGGRAVVLDKFVADDRQPSLARGCLGHLVRWFGTDITRRFGDLQAGCGLEVRRDEPALLGGAYRVLLLDKPSAP